MITGLLVGANQENVDNMVESISARIRLAESLRHCPDPDILAAFAYCLDLNAIAGGRP